MVSSVEKKKRCWKMARRKRFRKSSRSGLGGISNIVRQVGMGFLGAMVLGTVANKFAPQYSGIASIGGAYLTGGVMGALGVVVLQGGLGTQTTTSQGVMVV